MYLKTHKFPLECHRSDVRTLHAMFEDQYSERAKAVDVIAERIRALRHNAPGCYVQFQELSAV